MLPRHRSTFVLVVALLALPLAFTACRPKITAPLEPPLAVRLGDDAFRLQDYEAAIDDYGVYIDSVEQGEYTPYAFYQTALSWFRLEEYDRCLDTVTELSRRYPAAHWVQVDALRGDAQYKLGNRAAALMAWDEGWSEAKPSEKPEFRRRVVSLLREMDEADLAEAQEIVESEEIAALVEHHLAIQRQPHSDTTADTAIAAASKRTNSVPPAVPPAQTAAIAEVDVAESAEPAAPKGPSADSVADRAGGVAEQADEVVRLSDEVGATGDEMFEAIQETEDARGQILEVEESTATFAPLMRVDIPEPPFVDRPVPEPKRIIRVAAPEDAAAADTDSPAAIEEPVAVASVSESVEIVDLQRVAAAPAPPSAPNAAGVKVACVLPLTGGDRALGERLLQGIRLVFAEGSSEIVFRDSGSDPELARRLVAEVADDGDVLVAIAAAGDARSLASSAEQAAMPLLLLSSNPVPKSLYVLRVAPPAANERKGFADQFRTAYGRGPDGVNAQGYEAALLAREALQSAPIPRAEVLSRITAQSETAADQRFSGTRPEGTDQHPFSPDGVS